MSLRDDFSIVNGPHAFKMGYEILHFTDNFYQQGYPSGQFNFANTTAGLPAEWTTDSEHRQHLRRIRTGLSIRSQLQHLYQHVAAALIDQQPVFPGRLEVLEEVDFQPRTSLVHRKPVSHRAWAGEQFSPTAIDPLTGIMGAVIHPTGGLNDRDFKNFQPRIGMAYHPYEKWVFRGGFGINTVDIRWPNQGMQFDEYQAQVVQQRLSNNPLPLFQLSQGPAPVVYNIQPNGTAAYVGTNYGSRNITWLIPRCIPAMS